MSDWEQPASEIVIRADKLRRQFGHRVALDDVTFEVHSGAVTALLGANGAGKSTLLRLLRGLIRPTAGTCSLWNVDCRKLSDDITRRVCFMNDAAPPRWARLRQLAELSASIRPDFDWELVSKLLQEHGLQWNQPWATLSKGQQRWSMFAIGVASKPALWMLDEPCDGLDTQSRREFYDRLRVLCNEHGVTVLVSTHLIGDIERVADDVLLLHQGRVVLHAPLEDLREQVREFELPPGSSLTLPSSVTEIARQVDSSSTLIYARVTDSDRSWNDGSIFERPVGLETLYLALTNPPEIPGVHRDAEGTPTERSDAAGCDDQVGLVESSGK